MLTTGQILQTRYRVGSSLGAGGMDAVLQGMGYSPKGLYGSQGDDAPAQP
jgi:hypothetical protein